MLNVKTNAMRLLDKEKITYNVHTYDNKDGQIDGVSVAKKIGLPVDKVFKTLVTQGHNKEYFICNTCCRRIGFKSGCKSCRC